nr:Arm DNA-binding domain-containing protein [uncultured Undibacterium sp.]
MPKLAKPLTETQVKSAKTTGKPLKLSDGGGLFLLVNSDGTKYWRMAYRFGGKQKLLAFGKYGKNEVSLAEARAKRDEARKLLADDIDPAQSKRI